MSAAYKKSNEEKSLLILQLKEQLLASEREVFDLQINADSDSPANSVSVPHIPFIYTNAYV